MTSNKEIDFLNKTKKKLKNKRKESSKNNDDKIPDLEDTGNNNKSFKLQANLSGTRSNSNANLYINDNIKNNLQYEINNKDTTDINNTRKSNELYFNDDNYKADIIIGNKPHKASIKNICNVENNLKKHTSFKDNKNFDESNTNYLTDNLKNNANNNSNNNNNSVNQSNYNNNNNTSTPKVEPSKIIRKGKQTPYFSNNNDMNVNDNYYKFNKRSIDNRCNSKANSKNNSDNQDIFSPNILNNSLQNKDFINENSIYDKNFYNTITNTLNNPEYMKSFIDYFVKAVSNAKDNNFQNNTINYNDNNNNKLNNDTIKLKKTDDDIAKLKLIEELKDKLALSEQENISNLRKYQDKEKQLLEKIIKLENIIKASDKWDIISLEKQNVDLHNRIIDLTRQYNDISSELDDEKNKFNSLAGELMILKQQLVEEISEIKEFKIKNFNKYSINALSNNEECVVIKPDLQHLKKSHKLYKNNINIKDNNYFNNTTEDYKNNKGTSYNNYNSNTNYCKIDNETDTYNKYNSKQFNNKTNNNNNNNNIFMNTNSNELINMNADLNNNDILSKLNDLSSLKKLQVENDKDVNTENYQNNIQTKQFNELNSTIKNISKYTKGDLNISINEISFNIKASLKPEEVKKVISFEDFHTKKQTANRFKIQTNIENNNNIESNKHLIRTSSTNILENFDKNVDFIDDYKVKEYNNDAINNNTNNIINNYNPKNIQSKKNFRKLYTLKSRKTESSFNPK